MKRRYYGKVLDELAEESRRERRSPEKIRSLFRELLKLSNIKQLNMICDVLANELRRRHEASNHHRHRDEAGS